MDIALRVVTQLPLTTLWGSDGITTTARLRWLNVEDMANLLRVGPVQFVVADVGKPLRWISFDDRYEFWKAEIKPHLADPKLNHYALDDFPECYCYLASEWKFPEGVVPLVLLEKHH